MHQYQPPVPPQPVAKNGVSKLAVTLIAAGSLAAGCVGGLVVGGGTKAANTATAARTNAAAKNAPTTEEAAPTEEPVADYTPKPSDFTLKIITIEKHCFGSAGCNVTYRVDPSYSGPKLPDDKEFTVTYRVTGGEEPQINSLTVSGDQANYDSREVISTPSSSSVLRAKVTQVI